MTARFSHSKVFSGLVGMARDGKYIKLEDTVGDRKRKRYCRVQDSW